MLFADFIGKVVLVEQTSTAEWDQYIFQLISDPRMRIEALASVRDDPDRCRIAVDVLSIIASISEPDAEFDRLLFEAAEDLELHSTLGLLYVCGVGVDPDPDAAVYHFSQDPNLNRYYGPIHGNEYLLRQRPLDCCLEVMDLLNGDTDFSSTRPLFENCVGNDDLFSAEVLWNGMLRYISQGDIDGAYILVEWFGLSNNRVDHRLWDAVGRALCASRVLYPSEGCDRLEYRTLMEFRAEHIPRKMALSDFVRLMYSGCWTHISDIGQLGIENERAGRLESILPGRIIDSILTSEPFSIGMDPVVEGDVLGSAYNGDPASRYKVGMQCLSERQLVDARFWLEMSAQGFNIDAMRELVEMLNEDDPDHGFWSAIISQEERYASDLHGLPACSLTVEPYLQSMGAASDDGFSPKSKFDSIECDMLSVSMVDEGCLCDMDECDSDYCVAEECADDDEQPSLTDEGTDKPSDLPFKWLRRLKRS